MTWLEEGRAIKVLVELANPGCLVVRPWSPFGDEVVTRLGSIELDDGVGPTERALMVGAGIKFLPSTIDSSARLTFYEPFEQHLAISPGFSPKLCVLCCFDRIEVWNEEYYRELLTSLSEELQKFFKWSGTQY